MARPLLCVCVPVWIWVFIWIKEPSLFQFILQPQFKQLTLTGFTGSRHVTDDFRILQPYWQSGTVVNQPGPVGMIETYGY